MADGVFKEIAIVEIADLGVPFLAQLAVTEAARIRPRHEGLGRA